MDELSYFCTHGKGCQEFCEAEIANTMSCQIMNKCEGKIFFKLFSPNYLVKMRDLKTVERLFHLLLHDVKLEMKSKTDFLKLCNCVQSLDSDILQAYLMGTISGTSVHSCLSDKVISDCKRQKIEAVGSEMSFRVSCKLPKKSSKFTNTKELSKTLGAIIKNKTGWDVDLRNPKVEILVHINHEGTVMGVPLFQKPLAQRDYILHTGLRSTIAWIMSYLADIKVGDVVLDPMCGNAILLIEACKESNKNSFLGCDLCNETVLVARQNVSFAGVADHIEIMHTSATELPLRTSSVDKIICDLPFGNKHGNVQELFELYPLVVASMDRVLKPGGTAVLLTSTDLKNLLLESCASISQDKGAHTFHQESETSKLSAKDQVPGINSSPKVEKSKETCSHHICDEMNTYCIKLNSDDVKLTESSADEQTYTHVCCSRTASHNLRTIQDNEEQKPWVKFKQDADACEEEESTDNKVKLIVDESTNENTMIEKIGWTLKDSHYVSLGEMNAVICVFDKG